VWTDWLSQQILRIYLSQVRPYSQKIIYSQWTVLQVCKSTKITEVSKYLFQGSKQSYSTQFPDKKFLQFSLMISYLWNVTTSLVLGFGVCISLRSYYSPCRSPWSTSCWKWSSGAFAINVAFSLCDHNLVNSALTRNLSNNSKSMEFQTKFQQ
jgi:hypothetical protein